MLIVGLLALSVWIAQVLDSGDSVTVEGWSAAPVTLVALLFPVAAMVFGVQNLIAGYLGASEEGRRKLLWLLAGVSVSTWMILLPLLAIPVAVLLPPYSAKLFGDLSIVLWALAPGVLVSAVSTAVFYTGGVDPRLVLSRSSILGVLGTVWIIVFAALESLMSQWLSAAYRVPDVFISVSAALLAAGLALPFRSVAAKVVTRIARGGPS